MWDLADKQNLPEGVEPGSIDIIVMIFVLSALHPSEWRQAVLNVYQVKQAYWRPFRLGCHSSVITDAPARWHGPYA